MGNCLVIQDGRDKEIKIMGMDGGEILKLHQDAALATGFAPSHGIVVSDDPAADMAKAPPAAAAAVDTAGGVVRVKLVISKQQLKKMLHKDGVSLDDMVSLMQREASEQEMISYRGWRPALKSIPEGSDC
uniref:Uncharacterized protein n=1 Tax=Oryza punctata TaxID=4537 RepID=A0A0E0MCJ8_ORYPU